MRRRETVLELVLSVKMKEGDLNRWEGLHHFYSTIVSSWRTDFIHSANYNLGVTSCVCICDCLFANAPRVQQTLHGRFYVLLYISRSGTRAFRFRPSARQFIVPTLSRLSFPSFPVQIFRTQFFVSLRRKSIAAHEVFATKIYTQTLEISDSAC